MNTAMSPSKLLIGVIAVAALLGGCKKNDVTTTTPDTTMTAPATPAAPASSAGTGGSAGMTGSTGAAGTSGSGDAGMSNPAATGTTPANDATKPAVRNNSGETQGTTGSSVPAADGSR